MLPYAQFLVLWDKANPAQPDPEKNRPPVGAALTGYTLTGQTTGDVADLTLVATIAALAEGWSSVTLPAGLALREFSASDKRVLIERTAAGLVVHLPAPGTYTITAQLAAAVSKDAAGRRSLAVLAPAAAAGRLELLIADTKADVVVQPAVAVAIANEAGGTRLKAVLGAAPELMVSWQPPTPVATGAALLLATTGTILTVAERSLTYEVTATISILRRPVQEVTLTLPPSSQVLVVEAPGLRTWERDGDQLRLLLHEPVEGELRATIKLECLLPALAPGEARNLTVVWPAVAGAARTTGSVAVVPGEGLSLTVAAHDGLAQIDPAEVKVDDATGVRGATGVIGAYRHLSVPPPITLVVARLQSELRATLRQLVRLGVDEDLITLQLDLDVRKAGIFTLVLDVPAIWEPGDISGLAIDDLRTGAVVDGRKRIELALRGRLLGTGAALIRFRAPASIPRGGTAIAGLAIGVARLPDARQVRGTLALALPRSWALNVTTRSGLTGIEAEPLRRDTTLATLTHDLTEDEDLPLAFSFISGSVEKPAEKPVEKPVELASLTVAASPRPRELAVHQEDLVTVAEGSLRRALTWRGEVRFSPLPALRVHAPTSLDERITFAGAGLAEHTAVSRADGLTTWELRFQTPVLGAFQVTATVASELPALQSGQPATISLPVFKPLDATRLDVVLAIAREGTLEIAATATGMESLAPADVPAPLQAVGLVAGFQGGTPMAVELRVTRHDLVRLADGAVTLAHYAAALGDDGVVRVLGRLELLTRGRPWLEMRLPEGAELLEVVVAGRPGRPSRRADGAVVIPLGDSGAAGASGMSSAGGVVSVALVYEVRVLPGQPGLVGSLRVPLPTLGGGGSATDGTVPLPVERTEAALYLPEGLELTATRGDLAPLTQGTSVWEDLMRGLQPLPHGANTDHGNPSPDGLTVPVALHGTRHAFARLGDGGVIELHWWRRGVIDLLSLVVAVVGVLVVWWTRRHSPRLGAITLLAAVVLAAASGGWVMVAVGFAGGVAVGLVVLAVRWFANRPRAVVAPVTATNPWTVVEQAPPVSPSPESTGPTEPAS